MKLLRKFETDSNLGRKIIIIPIILIVCISILEIWIVNRLSTYGDQISNLEQREVSLKLENQILENQIAEKSSLLEIEKLSKSIGFNSNKNIEYIKADNLALK